MTGLDGGNEWFMFNVREKRKPIRDTNMNLAMEGGMNKVMD